MVNHLLSAKPLKPEPLKMSSKLSFQKACYSVFNACSGPHIQTVAFFPAKGNAIARTIEKRVALAKKNTQMLLDSSCFTYFYIKSQAQNLFQRLPDALAKAEPNQQASHKSGTKPITQRSSPSSTTALPCISELHKKPAHFFIARSSLHR